MPLFTIQIFKEGYGEKWSNRYLVECSGLAAAIVLVPAIYDREKSIHKDGVTFTNARVSDLVAANDVFAIVPLNDVGDVTATAAIIPLWNVVRVDIDVDGFGRPSRKYYRLPIAEDEQADGDLATTPANAVEAAVNQMITDVDTAGGGDGELVDPDGQSWNTATVVRKVAMRQLHRKRRRSVPA